MTARRLSIAQMNALGHRLRAEGLTDECRQPLELALADALDELSEVSEILRRDLPRVTFTPRLKTMGTILDKLMRERTMALSTMRDIAGLRIDGHPLPRPVAWPSYASRVHLAD